jgi:hypothetical protein
MMGPDAMVLPSAAEFAAEVQQSGETHDPETGELPPRDPNTGMTQVDEETARQLDAQQMGADDDGEDLDEDEGDKPAWWSLVEGLKASLSDASTQAAIKVVDEQFVRIAAGLPDDVAADMQGLIAEARKRVKGA